MNYYPFNLGDYAAHTGHLEPMEDLAYRRLLDVYYMREGPLPADINATAKLIRLRSCIADVESVLNEFFTLTDEGWRHGRCDEEIAKMREKQDKARASAAASVNARRAKAQLPSSTTVERTLPPDQANAERTLPPDPTDVQLPTPTPTPTPINYSVEAGKPAVDPADMTKEELWRAGKSLLEGAGVPKEQCGTFVGKLVKDYTDAVVIEAVRSAVVVTPADPKEYLKATCQRLAGERRRSLRPRNANPGMGELMEGAL